MCRSSEQQHSFFGEERRTQFLLIFIWFVQLKSLICINYNRPSRKMPKLNLIAFFRWRKRYKRLKWFCFLPKICERKKEGEREWSDMKEGRKGGEEAWNTLRQAEETIRFRASERKVFSTINKDINKTMLRYPVDWSLHSQFTPWQKLHQISSSCEVSHTGKRRSVEDWRLKT